MILSLTETDRINRKISIFNNKKALDEIYFSTPLTDIQFYPR